MQREQRHLTQTELARLLGTTYLSVCRWENGVTSPSLYYRKQLCELFGRSAEELGLTSSPVEEETSNEIEIEKPPSVRSLLWNVPYRRNPFFTGREQILERLAVLLNASRVAALSQAQAISGLGGIGKTQTAVEYAYRHRQDYQAILWVRAENREVLIADMVGLAELLGLAEKSEQDQGQVLAAVKHWLSKQSKWLLIMDNVEDWSVVEEIVPPDAQGHILLTSRTQATGGMARRLDLEKMEPEVGALFLLRRADLIAPDAPLEAHSSAQLAIDIACLLDGLPLALDQAGAYIEETGCSVADYLERYQSRSASLLKRRGRQMAAHPASVSMTFSLSFEKAERANPAAAELLQLCAFLAPDAIPEEIITQGATALGPLLQQVATDPFALDGVFAILRSYSLLRRNPDNKTVTIHRLVQAVIKDQMDTPMQRQWAERCVQAINCAFPDVAFAHWPQCQRLISQVHACFTLIEKQNLASPEAARLLNQAGWYLRERALFAQAELLTQRALIISEQVLGPNHLDTATTLNNLALLAFSQARYPQAEPLYQRALTIRKRVLGPEHPDVSAILDNLATLYFYQGRSTEAEPLYQLALAINERELGPDHPNTATTLHNMALFFRSLGRYQQAELLYERILTIQEKTLGLEHPDTGATYNNLALLYSAQSRYEEAEPLYQRVLAIVEKAFGLEHPTTAIALDNLAKFYYTRGQYEAAEPLYQRALAIEEQALGLDHPIAAITLNNLGQLSHGQGLYARAETFYLRSLAVKERLLGPEHPETLYTLDKLAYLYYDQGRYEQAEPLYLRILALEEQELSSEYPQTLNVLDKLVQLYRDQERYEQAEPLSQRALAIREQTLAQKLEVSAGSPHGQ